MVKQETKPQRNKNSIDVGPHAIEGLHQFSDAFPGTAIAKTVENIITDLKARIEYGKNKYEGLPVLTNNNRIAVQDAYEELQDCYQYLVQLTLEDKDFDIELLHKCSILSMICSRLISSKLALSTKNLERVEDVKDSTGNE